MDNWVWYLLLIPAGFLAGIVNTIAGGGSFLTLPALIFFCGMNAQIANGTNRVAILMSSASASLTFHRHGRLDRRVALQLAVPTLLGVPLGALAAIYLPNEAFEPIFGSLFLLMAVLIVLDPKRLVQQTASPQWSSRAIAPIFFAIGVYVGFIQAGMGILLLLGMSLVRTGDLVASNAVKNLIGFIVTLLAMFVFAVFQQIDWIPGLVMASGNVLGGIVGARLAIKKGNRLILSFLIVVMIATGIKLIWPILSTIL
ncbi:MAG: sulfite exporter TauE/SafE family protein [Planctomycetales bacterium]|nr:sulfite exporter TauE/SafE family protein [Planctomycetales bacterium]